MSHPITIPSDFGRKLLEALEEGRLTDEQKLRYFERLVRQLAWLEEEVGVDIIEDLRTQNRGLERELADQKKENAVLKSERVRRQERGSDTIRHAHNDRYAHLSRGAQENLCWEQREMGIVS